MVLSLLVNESEIVVAVTNDLDVLSFYSLRADCEGSLEASHCFHVVLLYRESVLM